MAPFSISNSLSRLSTVEDFLPPEPQGNGLKDDSISNERIRKNEVLQESYKVLSDPINGGMGSVWRVENMETGKELCMKRPQPKYFAEGGTARKELFIHECESWISLGLHPHIVACYYVREIGGVPTIFAEWMEGGSLEDRIRDKTLYSGTETEKQKRVLRIAIQFARGLRYAHECGLIHRDVKPDNVLLTGEGQARVADFGLSGAYAALGAEEQAAGKTETDPETNQKRTILVGSGGYTKFYCSPEQEARKELTRRTDIYSWAVSMLEVYDGEMCWTSGPEAGRDCGKHLAEAVLQPPAAMAELLKRCLNRDEAGRPHDFGEVDAALLEIYRDVCGEPYEEPGTVASGSADSLNNMAVSYMEIGLKDRALLCWEKAGEADPSHAETMFNRGLYDWRAGLRTGRDVWRRLITHPYYTKTEEGKRALHALARESAKPEVNTELKALMNEYRKGPASSCRLWHGKVYAWVRERGLVVMDPETWEETACYDLSGTAGPGDRTIRTAAMNADCSQILLHMSDNTLIIFDIASRKAVREAQLGEMSMYDSVNYMESFGAGSRFMRRSVSHGMGHVPPTPELYDLRLGKRISILPFEFNPWQMVRADEADGSEPLVPMGDEYRSSFSDGLRAVPVYCGTEGMMYCDEEGKPVAPIPAALASRLGDINSMNMNRGCLRITEDGRMWMLGNEGVMEFDLVTGKCLRSYGIRDFHDRIQVDEDGLGILAVTEEGSFKDREFVYRYCRLDPVRPEDRALFAFSAPENYGEYLERTHRLEEITEKFRRAAEEKKRPEMCRAYEEANTIHRFPGSAAQREMARQLNDSCRQKDGELFLCEEEEIPAEGQQREQALAFYGISCPQAESLKQRMTEQKWCSIGMSGRKTVSPDGRRAVICTFPEAPNAPAGPGVYLLDGEKGKLYLIPGASGTLWSCAGFCRDRKHIVHGNPKSGDLRLGIFDGSRVREAASRWEKALESPWVRLSVDPLPGTMEPSSVIWQFGLYHFRTGEDREAFISQKGAYMKILDVSEEYGLIAYQVTEESSRYTVRVWSVDERRLLLDRPLEGYMSSAEAAFIRAGEGSLRMLLVPAGLEPKHDKKPVHAEIYQFGCGYQPVNNRRKPPEPVSEWPEINLKECPGGQQLGWRQPKAPASGGADALQVDSEAALDRKGFELSHIKTADSLAQAYDVYCELVRRFPAKNHHRKNRDITVNHLKIALENMGKAGDTAGLEKYIRVFKDRLKKDPDEEKTTELLNFTEDHLGFILSNRQDLKDLGRALELYRELGDRQPEVPAHSRNAMIVSARILVEERKEKKKEKEAQGRKSLFSFLRKK